MRFVLVLALAAGCVSAAADSCDKGFETEFSSANLTIDSRAGDVDIVGVDRSNVRVECNSADIRVDFDSKKPHLRIHNGPRDNVRIRVEIPRNTNLTLSVSAGDVTVAQIRGHKDISVRAGDVTIETGPPEEYSSVEASVTAGEIKAPAFGVSKGGLFRSFNKQNSAGKYKLKASLWAGDLKLR